MEFEKIIELIHAVSESELTEFRLQEGDWKISMETAKGKKPETVVLQQTADSIDTKDNSFRSGTDAVSSEKMVEKTEGNVIKSPLVGTFYRSSSPDEPPFVQVGDSVKKGQVLGIVEAMKLMNEIESEFDGTVREIRVENEQMVEYGEVLFVIS